MHRVIVSLAFFFLLGSLCAEPADKYSLTHSTFIGTGDTWTAVTLSTMTVRSGDAFGYATVTSTATGGLVTIYDGIDTGGKLAFQLQTHREGLYPFEVKFSSNPTTGTVTISKTGTARVGLVFLVTHPVKEE